MKVALLVATVVGLIALAILWALSQKRPQAHLVPRPTPTPAREETVPEGANSPSPAATPAPSPLAATTPPPRPRATPGPAQGTPGQRTVPDRLAQYGSVARERWAPTFSANGLVYPPKRVALIGLKDERMLEVWAAADGGPWQHLRDYPILGMSGTLGPKLREGDGQAPEGLYRIESLNPNSAYHLSLRVDYPNAYDRARGAQDGRDNLGSDIMIHGKDVSIGCLAMGDEAAEDLFVLAAETGTKNISVILSPVDFRARNLPEHLPPAPAWTRELYREIREELKKFEL